MSIVCNNFTCEFRDSCINELACAVNYEERTKCQRACCDLCIVRVGCRKAEKKGMQSPAN